METTWNATTEDDSVAQHIAQIDGEIKQNKTDISSLQNFVTAFSSIRNLVGAIKELFGKYSHSSSTTEVTTPAPGYSNIYSNIGDDTARTSANPDGVIIPTGISYSSANNFISGYPALQNNGSVREIHVTREVDTDETTILFGAKPSTNAGTSDEIPLLRIDRGTLQANVNGTRANENWQDINDETHTAITFQNNSEVSVLIEAQKVSNGIRLIISTKEGDDEPLTENDITITNTNLTLENVTGEIGTHTFEVADVDHYVSHTQEARLQNETSTDNSRFLGQYVISTHEVDTDTFTGNLNIDGKLQVNGVDVPTDAGSGTPLGRANITLAPFGD